MHVHLVVSFDQRLSLPPLYTRTKRRWGEYHRSEHVHIHGKKKQAGYVYEWCWRRICQQQSRHPFNAKSVANVLLHGGDQRQNNTGGTCLLLPLLLPLLLGAIPVVSPMRDPVPAAWTADESARSCNVPPQLSANHTVRRHERVEI
ncbi:hypothetical protein BC939DRAFT_238402 [Gamsiella multidivaricata]|uniref:uncharacterized protein n=1 Tax=Gamsiella multidivaricata TaxID=101098 RepID=UPI00221E3FF8|nr:uncharacterized protein BC939DRAFT_238402 [Gamsiella multidivaricata]KAI7820314.1 hypothetical protein BC939DRAFT_238402 [Gamsiella multidivaricata]